MKKVYIGIDAHKESNVLALAFAGTADPELYPPSVAFSNFTRLITRKGVRKGVRPPNSSL